MVRSTMHGILESRAHRGAARRGRVLSDDFFGKHYGPAGEKNRTPPTPESAHVVPSALRFHLELRGPILELGGSKNFRSVLDS